MGMDILPLSENREWKGNVAGPWQARMDKAKARDRQLIADVNRWGVMKPILGCALLELPLTPYNLRMVQRRYQRLSQYKFHQIIQGDQYFYVTLKMTQSKAEHAQLDHRFMDVLHSSTFLRALQVEEYLNGGEIFHKDRLYTPNLIPDAFFKLNDADGLFREDETGESNQYDILPTCWKYFQQQDAIKREYGITEFRVLWNCKDPSWVLWTAQKIRQEMPEKAWKLFHILSEHSIDPFNPFGLLDDPIYLSPTDLQPHGFMG